MMIVHQQPGGSGGGGGGGSGREEESFHIFSIAMNNCWHYVNGDRGLT